VQDAALMLSVVSGEDRRDPLSVGRAAWSLADLSDLSDSAETLLSTVRMGASVNLGIATTDAEAAEIFRQSIDILSQYCHNITHVHPDCSMAISSFETLRAVGLRHKLGSLYEHHPERLSKSVRWNIAQGEGISAAELLQAQAERDQLYLNFIDFFDHHDVLITLSASVLPFSHSQPDVLEINGIPQKSMIDYLRITYAVSLTGLPAISIPCGRSALGLPVGLQLIGKPLGEAKLLTIAHAIQQLLLSDDANVASM
jgi:amidase